MKTKMKLLTATAIVTLAFAVPQKIQAMDSEDVPPTHSTIKVDVNSRNEERGMEGILTSRTNEGSTLREYLPSWESVKAGTKLVLNACEYLGPIALIVLENTRRQMTWVETAKDCIGLGKPDDIQNNINKCTRITNGMAVIEKTKPYFQ